MLPVAVVQAPAAVLSDLDEAVAYTHDLDVAGHDSRPDVFRLWTPGSPDATDVEATR